MHQWIWFTTKKTPTFLVDQQMTTNQKPVFWNLDHFLTYNFLLIVWYALLSMFLSKNMLFIDFTWIYLFSYLCRCNKGDMVQFLVKSNSVLYTASRHVANQNVWPTTKNASKMSLIAENKEEARSIWGIIKIYVHAVAMQ